MAKPPAEKSFFNPNKELVEALKCFGELVAENTRHVAAQTRWLRENAGAATKGDLEKAVNQSEERLMSVLLEIKGQMPTLKEQLDAQEAQLTAIATDVDGIVTSVTGINTDVQALKKQIEDLNNSPGELTPENQAALDRIQALAGSIATKTAAAKTAAAELDAATEPGGSGDGGQT